MSSTPDKGGSTGLKKGRKEQMAYFLVPIAGGPPVMVDRPIIVFGRHPGCDIRLDSRKVSRLHCCLVDLAEQGLCLRDLGSTNGTYINGQRIREAFIKPGDIIRIADVEYRLAVREPEPDEDEFPTPPQGAPSDVIQVDESDFEEGPIEDIFRSSPDSSPSDSEG